MAPPDDPNDPNARIRAQERRTHAVMLMEPPRRSTLPYGGLQPPPPAPPPPPAASSMPSMPPGWQDRQTVSMKAPGMGQLPPNVAQMRAPMVSGVPGRHGPASQPPRPAPPPPRAPAMPPQAVVPRAVAAPCRPSRPTPRVQSPPDGRMRQVHQRSEVIDALRAEINRLRRDK